ncbi:MAG TPA: hypothetical protein VHH88_04010, partial [Verrucomicrobiae bacterium]|nr:hypothetical protein [Verrucomicrobiae bacterium]
MRRRFFLAPARDFPGERFPPVVDPKPICRIAPNRGLESAVYVQHDRFRWPGAIVLAGWNLFTCFEQPFSRRNPVADPR